MKLEDQVTNLKLSKKLKKLGIKQDSYFRWWTYGKKWRISDTQTDVKMEKYTEKAYKQDPTLPKKTWYSAFTVAELGELLPDWNDMLYFAKKMKGEWGTIVDTFHVIRAKTEADARAEILIYLLENKKI